jgi:hypothetical protein
VPGHRAYSRFLGLADGRDAREALLDVGLHRLRIEVADRDDRHEVRAVPVAVERAREAVREALEVLARPDREARGVLSTRGG